VIDNLGDVGFCWRLAADLAARGHQVRLFIDDASALAWMAPQGQSGVQVLPTSEARFDVSTRVVVEAFGTDPPASYVQAMAMGMGMGIGMADAKLNSMATGPAAPCWINLEHLSAERYVARCHGLPSPQGNGLCKWFFYPGFTPDTGGLLRESDLTARQAERQKQERQDGQQQRRQQRHQQEPTTARRLGLNSLGVQCRTNERVVSLFCYENAALPQLLASLAEQPTLLLLTPGHAQQQVRQVQPPGSGLLRVMALPWLSQRDFDQLLAACDLNFVRGEDSLVRALWAGKPLVWQAYPQTDQAHHAKLEALLQAWVLCADPPLAPAVQQLWRCWNGLPQARWPGIPPLDPWAASVRSWADSLSAQSDLVSALSAFVHARLTPGRGQKADPR